jgi:hypothetical protein
MLKKSKKDKYDVMNQLIYIEFKYSAKSQIKNRLKEKNANISKPKFQKL